jgi:ubiquinone/menaquinone biosynthesis C-methylase UbiE
MGQDGYISFLNADKAQAESYYLRDYFEKTEQQKFLEKLVYGLTPTSIIDLGCGGGGTAYHLSHLFPNAEFTLVELNPVALNLAREKLSSRLVKGRFVNESIYNLEDKYRNNDLTLCLQTISWLESPLVAVKCLLRTCREGGRVIISGLFNEHHDIDIESTVIDYSRKSGAHGLSASYRTLSLTRFKQFISPLCSRCSYIPFPMRIDIAEKPSGLGTYTVKLENGERLQISGGMLMNWGFIVIEM